MWLLTGPFDGVATKTKLLKTGSKVPLGRKDRPLLVNNKKISRDHCEFTVGPCTQDNVANPSFIPTLQMYNAKDKAMSIDRNGESVVVNPSSTREVISGDKINIVAGISIEVNWRRIACFLLPARSLPSVSSEDCATLGINLVTTPSSLATHHLTSKYELTAPLATSLLSATQLVRVEWLQELIRLGITPDDSHPFKLTPLEQSFTLPAESKYRPIFSPALPSSLRSFKFWEPNEERLHLLKGYRFVLLSDTEDQVDESARELVTRGDGEYECFPLTNGDAKWRQLLAKARRKVDEAGLKVAIIAREHLVQAAVGEDKWQEMIADAQSLSLPFVSLDTLMNAVINVDISLINERPSSQVGLAESDSPLPDFVPNTHPDEPSLPGAVEKAQPEPNVPDRKSPSPPVTLFGLPLPPLPSKRLTRRAKPVSSMSHSEEPIVPEAKDATQVEILGYSLPPLPEMKRTSKLKRRTPVPAPSSELIGETERAEEPPLKKFKALFDASDPDKLAIDPQSLRDVPDVAARDSVDSAEGGESVTQSDSRPPHSQVAPVLEVVVEEEEESHQMDTDPAFLAVLASRKGKKAGEDDFDREFNKLRISKPNIRREEEEQPWEILGDFDTEAGSLRGNFMVIMDLEVFRRNSGHGDAAVVKRTYDGRPNFKKFKKIFTASSRTPIELVARAEHGYGVGSGYWKDGTQKRRAPTVLESDDADSDVPVEKTTKKGACKAPRSKATMAAEKLFLNSDEESAQDASLQGTTEKSRPRKVDSAPTNLQTRGSKRRHIIVNDDSDDGVAFKGFGKKQRVV